MKFGKITNLEGVDFTIPQLMIYSPTDNKKTACKVFLGTTGWSNKEWIGSYYPDKANAKDHLAYYSKLFDTIELNTTHYQIPSTEKVAKWCSQVNPSFQFCPKVPQDISHRSNLASETSQSRSFYNSILGMQGNLGPCFMQMPEYFDPSQSDKLLHFLNRKPADLSFAIELRHPKWFANDNFHLRLLAPELSKLNTGLVITDVAGRRDVCHGILPHPILLLRLIGNGLHASDFGRINQWVKRISTVSSQLDAVYVFFHQPVMSQIPKMVNHFMEIAIKNDLKLGIEPLKPKYQQNVQLRLF